MKLIISFIKINRYALLGIMLGGLSGYLYWRHFGIFWGSGFYSAECWVNCTYGCLFGGFLASLIFGKK